MKEENKEGSSCIIKFDKEQKKIKGKVGLIYSFGSNKKGELCLGDTITEINLNQ